MAAPLVLFAALLMWRTSPLLQAVNLVVAVCGAVAIGALRRTERRVAHAQVDDTSRAPSLRVRRRSSAPPS